MDYKNIVEFLSSLPDGFVLYKLDGKVFSLYRTGKDFENGNSVDIDTLEGLADLTKGEIK